MAEPAGGQDLTNFRLKSIEDKLDALNSNYVPVGIYNVNQEYTAEAIKGLITALANEATERKLATTANADAIELLKKSIQDGKDAREKDRKQFWTSVSIGGLLLVIGIFVNPIARVLGLGP